MWLADHGPGVLRAARVRTRLRRSVPFAVDLPRTREMNAAARPSAKRTLSSCLCLATLLALTACAESGTPRTLPSGRVIEVLESGLVGGSPPLWGIRYRSQLPAGDHAAFDAEAMELWALVQREADDAGARRASLWPVNLERHTIHLDGWRPILYTTYSFRYQFEKDDAGVWKHVPHEGQRVDQRATPSGGEAGSRGA